MKYDFSIEVFDFSTIVVDRLAVAVYGLLCPTLVGEAPEVKNSVIVSQMFTPFGPSL